MQNLVSLLRSHWFIFVFISIALEDWPKKALVQLVSRMFCLCSLLGVFWCLVLCLSLKAILSLFLCMAWGCVLVTLIYMQLSNLPSTICWIDCLFPILCSCLPCQRLIDHKINSKNKLKMAGRLKSKTRHHQTPRREHRQNILWYQPPVSLPKQQK